MINKKPDTDISNLYTLEAIIIEHVNEGKPKDLKDMMDSYPCGHPLLTTIKELIVEKNNIKEVKYTNVQLVRQTSNLYDIHSIILAYDFTHPINSFVETLLRDKLKLTEEAVF